MGKKTEIDLEDLLKFAQEEESFEKSVPSAISPLKGPLELDKETASYFSMEALNYVAGYAKKFEISDHNQLYELFHLVRNGLIKGYLMGQGTQSKQHH